MKASLRPAALPRFVRTVAHLRSSQVWHRLRLTAHRKVVERFADRYRAGYRRRAERLGATTFEHPGLDRVASLRLAQKSREESLQVAGSAVERRFRFLGRTEDLGDPVAWHAPSLHSGTRLWKTYLHEFSFALDLASAWRESGEARYRAALFELIDDWRQASPLGHRDHARDSWNARAVATRMIHWMLAGSVLELDPESPEGRNLGTAIAEHALFLADHLELDLLGNHLLRNAVGLVFADAVVGGFPEALPLLREQVDAQVLADGCHCERTPLYHAVALQDLAETCALLGDDAPGWLREATDRMHGFLRHLVGPELILPLFGDSWLGEVDVRRLLAALPARASRPVAPEVHSGLVVLERGTTRAVLRAGAHGPDYQLGHAHADLLSFEATIGGRRAITDSGGGCYDPGEDRTRLRSTAAHNTVAIDGEELLEAWGSFRSGRRGRASVVRFADDERGAWCWARHDGYRWLDGCPTHHRLLAVADGMLLALDVVTGEGRHRLSSYLHLHPEAKDLSLQILTLGGDSLEREAPLYERFHRVERMSERMYEAEGALPWAAGWLVLEGGPVAGERAELRLESDRVSASYVGGRRRAEAVWRFSEPEIDPLVTLERAERNEP